MNTGIEIPTGCEVRLITSRWPGKCKACGLEYERQSPVYWVKGARGLTYCVECYRSHVGSEKAIERGEDERGEHEVETEAERRARYESMSVAELKKACMGLGIGSGVWRQGAAKAALIEALVSGQVVEKGGSGMPPAPIVEPGPIAATGAAGGDAIAALLAKVAVSAVEGRIQALETEIASKVSVTPEQVQGAVDEALRIAREPLRVEVQVGETVRKVEGLAHHLLPKLIRVMARRQAPFMVGPAGTGKTSAWLQAAEALGVRPFVFSCHAQMTESRIFGYQDARGQYRPSLFREAWERGGAFLFDEGDNMNENLLASVNGAVANGHCAFPDGMVERHPDCIIGMAGNTFGTGADRVYVGRTQLDGATLDRFAFIPWPVDEALEGAATGVDQESWIAYVRKCREAADRLKSRHIISPRASIEGARALRDGDDVEFVLGAFLWRGCGAEDRRRIEAEAGVYHV